MSSLFSSQSNVIVLFFSLMGSWLSFPEESWDKWFSFIKVIPAIIRLHCMRNAWNHPNLKHRALVLYSYLLTKYNSMANTIHSKSKTKWLICAHSTDRSIINPCWAYPMVFPELMVIPAGRYPFCNFLLQMRFWTNDPPLLKGVIFRRLSLLLMHGHEIVWKWKYRIWNKKLLATGCRTENYLQQILAVGYFYLMCNIHIW